MAISPTLRYKHTTAPATSPAAADFLGRRLAGLPAPPRGHYGPVDEELVAELRLRLKGHR